MPSSPFTMNAIIADDEAPSRQLLRQFLAGHDRTRVVGEAATGSQALAIIQSQLPDIVFLDIRMPEGNGFNVLEQLHTSIMIVFITAYDQFAVRAFDQDAFDYLLKPFDQDRVFRTLDQAYQRLEEQRALAELRSRKPDRKGLAHDPFKQAFPRRLMIKEKGKIFFLPVNRIRWISAEGVYACLHIEQDQHLIRRSLNDLAETLDPRQFVRIHRSTIVNADDILTMESAFRGDYFVHMKCGSILKMSRHYRDAVFETLSLV